MINLKNTKLLAATGLIALSACGFAATHDVTINYQDGVGADYQTLKVKVMQGGQQVTKSFPISTSSNKYVIQNIDSLANIDELGHTGFSLTKTSPAGTDTLTCGNDPFARINKDSQNVHMKIEDHSGIHCYISVEQ